MDVKIQGNVMETIEEQREEIESDELQQKKSLTTVQKGAGATLLSIMEHTPSEKRIAKSETEYSELESDIGRTAQAKAAVNAALEHRRYIVLMALFTCWALFSDDTKLATTNKNADSAFEVIITIGFFLFLLEIVAQMFCKPDYIRFQDWPRRPYETWSELWRRRLRMGSFYFWLDLLATLSLILEISWIIGDSAPTDRSGSGTTSAQAGKASRAGVRAGRVVRLVRMARLVRLPKLFKYFLSPQDNERLKSVNSATPFFEYGPVVTSSMSEDKRIVAEESHVGAAMTELINQRVILLVLLMIVIIPIVTVHDADTTHTIAATIIRDLAALNFTDTSTPPLYMGGLNLAITAVMTKLPVLLIQINEYDVFADYNTMNSRRITELDEFSFSSVLGLNVYVTFDNKERSVQSALFSLYTTIFIIVLLVGGTIGFTSDVNRLVIYPIERLVELVRKISKNPLGVEYKMLGADEGFIEGMETTVLLATITKIGLLMRVGFGEAGAAVIAKNMSTGTGKLNLMGGGTRIMAIFGFCDVRQFTDTTECLQEEVMLFVNRIAHILHSIVVQCSGAANKNIGDAFLLTWKVEERYNHEQRAFLADQALLAFCKALIELSRYQDFICNFSVAATARLYKRFPEYNVRIGSGLHYGWAVEGAIGSGKKIDASYLSPNVNTSEFLESSTKAYGVPLLLSEPFYKLLSPVAARYCRQVDRIRRSAAEEPMGLYAYDADLNIPWDHYSGAPVGMSDRTRLLEAIKKAQRQVTLRATMQKAARRGTVATVRSTMSNAKPSPPVPVPTTTNAATGPKMKFKSLINAQIEHRRKVVIIADNDDDDDEDEDDNTTAIPTYDGHHSTNPPPPELTTPTFDVRKSRRQSTVGGLPPIVVRPTHIGPSARQLRQARQSTIVTTHGTVGGGIPPGNQPSRVTIQQPSGVRGNSNMDLHTAEAAEKEKNDHKTVAPTIVIPPYTHDIWEENDDLVRQRHQISDSFRALWEEGITHYIKGEWTKAREVFNTTLVMSKGKDGPSLFLLSVINEHDGAAPDDWPGHRTEGGGH